MRSLPREEQLPPPELGAEHGIDPLGVRLEGLGHALVSPAEADAERAEREATLRPFGGGLGEAIDVLDRDAPALFVVGTPQGGELHYEAELVGVLVRVEKAYHGAYLFVVTAWRTDSGVTPRLSAYLIVESGVLTPVVATKRHFQLIAVYNERLNIIAQNGRKVNNLAYISSFIDHF